MSAVAATLALTAAETANSAAPASKAPTTKSGVPVTKAGAKTAAPKQATPKPVAKTGTAKPAAKSFVSTKSAAPKTGAATAKTKPVSKPSPARYPRSSQSQPTADRYRDIQQALTDKGYFAGPVDGVWGGDSIEALKRFQRDQNLTDDGKLGSLSLIALGLGPRREASAIPPAPERNSP
jgi:peptidoglycan hydrolase-like protein with peptidoglycan-binding domain